jgi:hypothetical protein
VRQAQLLRRSDVLWSWAGQDDVEQRRPSVLKPAGDIGELVGIGSGHSCADLVGEIQNPRGHLGQHALQHPAAPGRRRGDLAPHHPDADPVCTQQRLQVDPLHSPAARSLRHRQEQVLLHRLAARHHRQPAPHHGRRDRLHIGLQRGVQNLAVRGNLRLIGADHRERDAVCLTRQL